MSYQDTHCGGLTLLFQAIQFIQTVLIQLVQFSISIDFVYTQLNVKTVLLLGYLLFEIGHNIVEAIESFVVQNVQTQLITEQ